MKRTVFLVVVIAMLLTVFVSCDDAVGIEGKWYSVYASENSEKVAAKDMFEFEVKKDGTLTATMGDITGEQKGTWRKEGNKYIFTFHDYDICSATIEGKLLKLQPFYTGMNGIYIYLTKDITNFKYPEDVKFVPYEYVPFS